MPDISMCLNSSCPLCEECYRYKAKPSLWQAYAYFAPDENGKCDHFMEIYKPRENENQ